MFSFFEGLAALETPVTRLGPEHTVPYASPKPPIPTLLLDLCMTQVLPGACHSWACRVGCPLGDCQLLEVERVWKLSGG